IMPDHYYPIYAVDADSGDTVATAVGSTLCFSGDILTPPDVAINLPKEIKRGDLVLVNHVGAYAILGSGRFHNMPNIPVYIVDANSGLTLATRPQG
ncbi:MAG: hypothetical protein HQM16_02800, partial [Deltaproteobacteria bacterium]|nr:hypothetical protein [Deltaproteobacteria bacterium]